MHTLVIIIYIELVGCCLAAVPLQAERNDRSVGPRRSCPARGVRRRSADSSLRNQCSIGTGRRPARRSDDGSSPARGRDPTPRKNRVVAMIDDIRDDEAPDLLRRRGGWAEASIDSSVHWEPIPAEAGGVVSSGIAELKLADIV